MVGAVLAGQKTQTRRIAKEFGPEHEAACADSPTRTAAHMAGPVNWVRQAWRSTSNLDPLSGTRIAELSHLAGYNAPWAPIQYEADGQRRESSSPPYQ